jgi:hypothetical protein
MGAADLAGREQALAAAARHFDSGEFVRDLARRVAIRTESQNPASGPELQRYLADEMAPSLAAGVRKHAARQPGAALRPLADRPRVEDPTPCPPC